MIELRKIYQPHGILNLWGYINKGVERVCDLSREDISLDSVFNDLASGNALLWIGFKDNKYLGFIITKIQVMPFGNKTLLIYATYANRKVDEAEWMDGLNQLDEYAKAMGCGEVELYTVRDKGFEKRLSPYGYKRKYVVFSREVV